MVEDITVETRKIPESKYTRIYKLRYFRTEERSKYPLENVSELAAALENGTRRTIPFPNELIDEKRKSRSLWLARKHAERNVKEARPELLLLRRRARAYYAGARIANKFAALLYRINST